MTRTPHQIATNLEDGDTVTHRGRKYMAVVVDDTTIILENGTETVELDIIDTRGGGYVSATRVDGDVIHPSYPVEDFQLAENPEISRIDANELFRKGSEVAAARVSD